MRTLRNNGLGLFFLALLLLALMGQAIAGHAGYNDEQRDHAALVGEEPETISLGRYVTSSHFGQAVMENWQSEYLQFTLFILATVWLVQRGSPESKRPERAGRESERAQRIGAHAEAGSPRWARAGGLRTLLYSNSLLVVMGVIFLAPGSPSR